MLQLKASFEKKSEQLHRIFASQWLHSVYKRPQGAFPSFFQDRSFFVQKKVFIINLLSVTRKPEKAQRFRHLKGVNEWLWYLKGKEKTPFYRSGAKKRFLLLLMCFRAPNVVFLCILFERERFSGGVEVEEVEIPGQASVEICTRNLFSLPIAIRTRQRKKQLNTKTFLLSAFLLLLALESSNVYRCDFKCFSC